MKTLREITEQLLCTVKSASVVLLVNNQGTSNGMCNRTRKNLNAMCKPKISHHCVLKLYGKFRTEKFSNNSWLPACNLSIFALVFLVHLTSVFQSATGSDVIRIGKKSTQCLVHFNIQWRLRKPLNVGCFPKLALLYFFGLLMQLFAP